MRVYIAKFGYYTYYYIARKKTNISIICVHYPNILKLVLSK